jgi:hypothetical protein
LGTAIKRYFWNDDRKLFSDDMAQEHYSQHCQGFALLSGLIEGEEAAAVFDNMCNESDLAEMTIYFRHYLFECMKEFDRGDLILEGFAFWNALKDQGFKTTVESPEPSRSDCHAWGAHPLFHMHASLLGLRPTAIGFTELSIAPSPGALRFIKSETPHPAGPIVADLEFKNDNCVGNITLPDGLSGTFHWKGDSVELSGTTSINC